MTRAHARLLVESLLFSDDLNAMKYSELFAQKDELRCEAIVVYFFMTFVLEGSGDHPWNFSEPEYNEIGGLSKFMPSFRARLLEANPTQIQ